MASGMGHSSFLQKRREPSPDSFVLSAVPAMQKARLDARRGRDHKPSKEQSVGNADNQAVAAPATVAGEPLVHMSLKPHSFGKPGEGTDPASQETCLAPSSCGLPGCAGRSGR